MPRLTSLKSGLDHQALIEQEKDMWDSLLVRKITASVLVVLVRPRRSSQRVYIPCLPPTFFLFSSLLSITTQVRIRIFD